MTSFFIYLRQITNHGNIRFNIIYVIFIQKYCKWSSIYLTFSAFTINIIRYCLIKLPTDP